MYRRILVGGLALVLAGCASQQGPAPEVVVEDITSSREPEVPAEYVVESGDTLYAIAWRHDMDYRDMARLNNIQPPYTLQPGQRLTLGKDANPRDLAAADTDAATSSGSAVTAAAAGAVVATGLGSDKASASTQGEPASLDWLLPFEGGEAAAAPGPVVGDQAAEAANKVKDQTAEQQAAQKVTDAEAIAKKAREEAAAAEAESRQRAEQAAEEEKAKAEAEAKKQAEKAKQAAQAEQEKAEQSVKRYTPVAEVPWNWPVSGKVTGGFGKGSSVTAGIDIAGQKGQPVKAAGPGIVVYAGDGVRGYGNLILLKHNDQFLSAYAHNSELKVSENDVVSTGDVIATMGDSGADSVRLHFEVRKDGQPQNPLDYLPKR